MSNDTIDMGSDKEDQRQRNLFIKLLVITQAITAIIIYILMSRLDSNFLKYIIIFDAILTVIFIINVRPLVALIKSILTSTGSLYAIVSVILYISLIVSSKGFMKIFAEVDNFIYLFSALVSIVIFTMITVILIRSRHIKYLRDIINILAIGLIYNLLDLTEIIPEDIKSLIMLLLGVSLAAALVKLIIDILGVSSSAVISLFAANKAAMILAGILQLAFWKNKGAIEAAFGLENYQVNILSILFVPFAVCLELAIEVYLKRLYRFISMKLGLPENYYAIIYLLMLYILALFMIKTGLANDESESYIFSMVLNPAIVAILTILVIVLGFVQGRWGNRFLTWKERTAIIFAILAILVAGYFIYLTHNTNTNTPVDDEYAIMVSYNGSWVGSIYDDTNRTDITGTGNPKVPIKVIKLPITIDIQKTDDDHGILMVDILKNDEKIKTGSAPPGYKKVAIKLERLP